MNETLREFVDSRGQTIAIDRVGGLVRGVKILGFESRNGRTYLPEAIRNAASLYEEAKVNVNHYRKEPLAPRDYRDRIGVIRNVTVREGDGLFADFHFNPKHELAEQFLWDAEHAPENVGFSHNVTAQVMREGKRLVVEKILEVKSVDLVADPATTNGLFESLEDPEEKASEDVSSETTTPEVKDASCGVAEAVDDARAELQEMCDQLRKEVARLEAERYEQDRRHFVDRLLYEVGLPLPDSDNPWAELVASDDFVKSLMKLDDDRAIREQVYRRAALLRQAGACPGKFDHPRSRERVSLAMPSQPETTESFVQAIKI